ncbi:MAG TPA: hypothetical protein VGR78_14560 [Verrucomicrobiae bacterium]|nr:hypothetical protein [Verrucomicrobiae bacterium]
MSEPGRFQFWPQPRKRLCNGLPKDSTDPLPRGAPEACSIAW